MENFLSDQGKFQRTAVKDDNFMNFMTSQEKRINKIFKKLVGSNSNSQETRRHLKSVGTRPTIKYGSCKVHNKCVNGCPSFRAILSALEAPTYKLPKYLESILEPLTNNRYIVKDSFNFALKLLNKIPAVLLET